MPAHRFPKIVQETGKIPVCSFYLPVSTSRNHPVPHSHSTRFIILVGTSVWQSFLVGVESHTNVRCIVLLQFDYLTVLFVNYCS